MPGGERSGPTLKALLALETQVWEALRTGDAALDAELLDADFLGVYPSGFAGRADHAAQLATGPSVVEFEISNAVASVLSEDAGLLTYEARFTGRLSGGADRGTVEKRMYVTSLWRRRDGRWVSTFNQDTPAEG